MTVIPRDQTTIYVDGSKASYVACPEGQQITLSNVGNTLYYKSTSDVTSSSNDGSIATAASASFTSGQYVICAQGVGTSVLVKTTEGDNANFRVGGGLTVAGATTLTGAVTNTGGIVPGAAPSSIVNVPIITTTQGTDTINASGTELVTSVFVPCNKTIANIGVLNGSVSATDKVIAVLYSSTGAVLANSTVTSNGTLAANAATVQTFALTTAYAAVGPALYYVGVRANGTNSRFRTMPAQLGSGNYAQTNTVTHATVAAFTPAGTFTADNGPYVVLT